MSKIFGVDIAKNVYSAYKGNLETGTLTRTAKSNYDPDTDSETTSTTSYSFDGLVMNFDQAERKDSDIQSNDRKILIIGDSLSVEPTNGDNNYKADIIELQGQKFEVVKVTTDAAKATHIVQGRL